MCDIKCFSAANRARAGLHSNYPVWFTPVTIGEPDEQTEKIKKKKREKPQVWKKTAFILTCVLSVCFILMEMVPAEALFEVLSLHGHCRVQNNCTGLMSWWAQKLCLWKKGCTSLAPAGVKGRTRKNPHGSVRLLFWEIHLKNLTLSD